MKRLTKCSDDVLVQAYLEGRNEAFDELLVRNQRPLLDFIMALTHDKNRAEDLFQETLIRAIMKLKDGQYCHQGKFVFWLMRIARNLLIDEVRKQRKALVVSIHSGELLAFVDRAPHHVNREELMMAEEMKGSMRQLMESLPEEQREVVVMRYYQGLQFKDIAEITQVSINTSLGRMHYALRNMRRMARQRNIL